MTKIHKILIHFLNVEIKITVCYTRDRDNQNWEL